MKKIWEFLKEHAIKVILFKKKKINAEQQEPCENTKICYICKEIFVNEYLNDKKNRKVRYHCHYTGEYRGA